MMSFTDFLLFTDNYDDGTIDKIVLSSVIVTAVKFPFVQIQWFDIG